MKFLKFLSSYLNPKKLVKFKDINIIIAICIFVISSFILGTPVGKGANEENGANGIYEHKDYQVLKEIPYDDEVINNKISDLISKECKITDKINSANQLECANYENGDLYLSSFSFVSDGITKDITIVIDLFEIQKVYIDEVKPNYVVKDRFTVVQYPEVENTEYYLIRFATDTLYFQARPFGSKEKVEVTEVYYENFLPNFSINSESIKNVEDFGTYILDQLVIGNANKIKLKSYTLTFLIGVLFTLITIIILWLFFRKNGILKKFSEYYNIAAITSLPISIIFFILLWFNHNFIDFYLFIFSLAYVIVLYKINTSEEII